MGQEESAPIVLKAPTPLRHESILRLQSTPFRDSIQLNPNLFLQSSETTLASLIHPRLHSTKLFPYDDIITLIQSIVFALSYAHSHHVIYKDLSPNHIAYQEDGCFKIFPNQLILHTISERLKRGECPYASPQLIIAHRCNYPSDEEMLEKSSVFALGMVLIQATTMLPSVQCYETGTNDILDDVISQRIALVEEYYDCRVARLIAAMLDYDYSLRIGIKELAVWVNREFNLGKSTVQLSKIKGKNNSVYMQEDYQGEDKNKVYMHKKQHQESINNIKGKEYVSKEYNHKYKQHLTNSKQNQYTPQNYKYKAYFKQNNADSIKYTEDSKKSLPNKNELYIRKSLQHAYKKEENEQNWMEQKPHLQMSNVLQERTNMIKERNTKYTKHQDVLQDCPQTTKLRRESKIGSREEGLEDKSITRKKEEGGQNRSISRIKEEIEKSRRLIEQFRKNEGLK